LVLTAAFLVVRWISGHSFRLVNVIPDYGKPNRGFWPRFRFLRADTTLVTGADTYASIVQKNHLHSSELARLGAVVAPVFREAALQLEQLAGSKSAMRDATFPELGAFQTGGTQLQPALPLVCFFGGSGFSGHCLPVIRQLAKHPELGRRFQMAVLCGKDEVLRQQMESDFAHVEGMAWFGFMPQATLAKLCASVDVPVLGSIAHSSLQEYLEVGLAPLFVFHVIDGTEPPYIPYIESHGLGLYLPEIDAMTHACLAALKLESPQAELAQILAHGKQNAAAARAESVSFVENIFADLIGSQHNTKRPGKGHAPRNVTGWSPAPKASSSHTL
jgi:hypothetical protein